MAAITWEQIDAKCGDDDNITITIQELTDGSPTVVKTLEDGTEIYRTYSARFHKDRPVEDFKAKLKSQILADRDKSTKENAFSGKIDLSDFVNYLNQ